MNASTIEHFLIRYLESLDCQIIEKGVAHITVKLSPEADKELTQRPYYWNFIERTGALAETMTFNFIFDPEMMRTQMEREYATNSTAEVQNAKIEPSSSGSPTHAQDSILGRYFGYVPSAPVGRIPRDEVTVGSRRLEQIFTSVRNKGKCVRLFEEAPNHRHNEAYSKGYSSWLGINFKVELACDLKRNEMHSIGLRLTTGEIVEQFHDWMLTKKLGPRLPPNIYLLPTKITLERAATLLENHLEKKLKRYDHTWADEALKRLEEELNRIEQYYQDMLEMAEEDKKLEVEQHHIGRKKEIEWQYRPKIMINVINCGLFHLSNGASSTVDGFR